MPRRKEGEDESTEAVGAAFDRGQVTRRRQGNARRTVDLRHRLDRTVCQDRPH